MAQGVTKAGSGTKRYGDIALAVGVMAIMALMVLRLPTAIIDVLVAINIACGVALLLIALYLPHPVAFTSFPSVLLISTLFRLSLSVATTRLILLDAHAGHIIDAFGKFVAGGNLVVGIVVFIIITIVQFIVIAKGAERVAEVAARFTLDAMPGKQLSIDSDLRSGLIDKEEAKRRRSLLEQESQMNGALDGAMKFVKGDAIASIVIVVVNLLGGLTIGVLQKGMAAGEAMELYSILTIGDGMVAQIPALLSAMAAGLVVTRSADDTHGNLGASIGRQFTAHPRALMMTGVIALALAFVPGFPAFVFIGVAAVAFTLARHAMHRAPPADAYSPADGRAEKAQAPLSVEASALAQPFSIELSLTAAQGVDLAKLRRMLAATAAERATALGIALPTPVLTCVKQAQAPAWRISIYDVPVCAAEASSEVDADKLCAAVGTMLVRHAERFVGVQEVSTLLDAAAEQYPALVKEVLRQVPAQRIAEVIRNLLREEIPVRNLRDILEAINTWSAREKDTGNLTEIVRIHLKRYMSNRFAGPTGKLAALIVDGAAEELMRRAVTDTPTGAFLVLPPAKLEELRQSVRTQLASLAETVNVVIASADVRRHVRQVLESFQPALPVISYQELQPEVEVRRLGIVRFQQENS